MVLKRLRPTLPEHLQCPSPSSRPSVRFVKRLRPTLRATPHRLSHLRSPWSTPTSSPCLSTPPQLTVRFAKWFRPTLPEHPLLLGLHHLGLLPSLPGRWIPTPLVNSTTLFPSSVSVNLSVCCIRSVDSSCFVSIYIW